MSLDTLVSLFGTVFGDLVVGRCASCQLWLEFNSQPTRQDGVGPGEKRKQIEEKV